MRSPYPPAPMNAAMVAVPTQMTMAVRTPATMVGKASGSSMRSNWSRRCNPSASDASFKPAGTSARPVQVLRTIGSSAYSVSATSAGPVPMTPISEISTASIASDGIVCNTLVAPSTHGAPGAARRHRDRERDADQRRHAHRHEHEHQMLQGQASEVGSEQLADEAALRLARLAPLQEIARNHVEGDTLQLGARVHRDHRALVDAIGELLQRAPRLRKARRHVEPVQHHRVVARKVAQVVGEHAQAEVLDLRVGRVDVDHVDLPIGQRVVGEAVVDARAADAYTRSAARGPSNRRHGR